MKLDHAKFYAYAYREGRDASESLYVVPEDVFRVLKEHEDELDSGNIPDEAEEAFDKIFDCEDLFGDVTPRQIDNLPEDHFVRVTLC